MKKKGIEIGIFMIIIFDLIDLISGDKDCGACFSGTGMYKRQIFDMESNLYNIRVMVIEFEIATYPIFIACDEQEIDEDNWRETGGECGKLPKEKSSSRISNAIDSDVHYPWVVRVAREFKGKKLGECVGSIINAR